LILITGGTGFIGSHFMQIARSRHEEVANLGRETWDFREPQPPYLASWTSPKIFIHFGANVKARQSVDNPWPFVQDNILGTYNVLELARRLHPSLFVFISSAEALGGCDKGYLGLESPMKPSNPYAATKAAGELLTYTYYRSYRLPAIIVRTQCVWDILQKDPTKAVPIIRDTIMAGKPVKIYHRRGRIGSRQWIHVDEFCNRLLNLLPKAIPGETYHIVGEELTNLQLAELVAKQLDMPLLTEPEEISPTHELRYALTGTKE
jgi:dTDP-glucose 4,6-dehydratase